MRTTAAPASRSRPAIPNEIGPRKRPFHTLMPALVHREGRLAAVAASMGGASQPQINAENLIRAFDLGMTAGGGGRAPRWTVWDDDGPLAWVEGLVPDATRDLTPGGGLPGRARWATWTKPLGTRI